MYRSLNLLLLTLLISCSRDDKGIHSFRIYEENGVTIAETSGGPKYTDPLFLFEEILRLEQDPVREETLYHQAAGFLMGPDGGYYLLDQGRACILRYDAEGRFIGSFGGKGDGPGEFNFPSLEAIEGVAQVVHDLHWLEGRCIWLRGGRPVSADLGRHCLGG